MRSLSDVGPKDDSLPQWEVVKDVLTLQNNDDISLDLASKVSLTHFQGVQLSDSEPTVKLVINPFSPEDSLDEADLESVFTNFG